MRKSAAALLIGLTLSTAEPVRVGAWGFTAHRYIMEHAIPFLPQEIRPFFVRYRTTLIEHAIDPDTYRTVGFIEESPRHFLDMDAYGPFPFTSLPHDYREAVAQRGADFVTKNGLLPWRTQEISDRLRDAFTQRTPFARDDIKLFAAVLSHYTGDAFQPLHAAVNYDGQLTGQQGIHARFETELFERYQDRLHVTPGPLVAVPSAREFVFRALTDSFRAVDGILAADRAAAQGRDAYDDEYFAKLFERTKPILEGRLSGAISGVASVITAAWEQAGRPPVPENPPPRPPRPIQRGRESSRN
jgi:hypothetical protein